MAERRYRHHRRRPHARAHTKTFFRSPAKKKREVERTRARATRKATTRWPRDDVFWLYARTRARQLLRRIVASARVCSQLDEHKHTRWRRFFGAASLAPPLSSFGSRGGDGGGALIHARERL